MKLIPINAKTEEYVRSAIDRFYEESEDYKAVMLVAIDKTGNASLILSPLTNSERYSMALFALNYALQTMNFREL